MRILVPLLLAVLAVSCSSKPVLKIGVIAYDYSREPDIEGFSTDMATQMAARDWNSQGDLEIQLVRVWVSAAPEDSVNAVRQLVNRQGVSAIVGPPTSNQAIAAGAAAEQARVPLLSAVSSNPATTSGRIYVFRMCFLDPDQARAQVAFARSTIHPSAGSLVFFASEGSSAQQAAVIRAEYANAGSPLRQVLGLTRDDPDFDQKIASAGPWTDPVVFLPTSSGFALSAAKSLRAAGFRGVFVGGDGWDRTEMAAAPEFDGATMTTNYWSGQTTPGNGTFVAEYEKFAGRLPGDTAALTYDAVGLLATTALRTGRTDSESLTAGLHGGPPYQGVAGTVSFGTSGDPVRPVVLLRFENGTIGPGGPLSTP